MQCKYKYSSMHFIDMNIDTTNCKLKVGAGSSGGGTKAQKKYQKKLKKINKKYSKLKGKDANPELGFDM